MKYLFLLLLPLNSWAKFIEKAFEADFVQSHTRALSGKVKKTHLKISYDHPNKIRIKGQDPDNFTFVSNGLKSWYYSPPFLKGGNGSVRIQSRDKFLLSEFFLMITKGLKKNLNYTIQKVRDRQYRLLFKKDVEKKLGIKEAFLSFKPKKAKMGLVLKGIEKLGLVYSNDKLVEFSLKNYRKKKTFPKEFFVFKIPPNTEQLGQ